MATPTALEVVKSAYAAFRAGDFAGVTALCAPDTEWTLYGRIPWAGRHRGIKAVQEDFFEKMASYSTVIGFDTPVIMAGEDPAWVFTPTATWTAKWKNEKGETGDDSIEVPMCLVFEVRDGKIKRYWNYADTDRVVHGLKKAGLQKIEDEE